MLDFPALYTEGYAMHTELVAHHHHLPKDEGRLWGLVSQYEHTEVVRRLMDEEGWVQKEAQEVFMDTLRFLYLCHLRPRAMAPTKRIDKGWHAFILYTKDYASFCDVFFGRFIHHQPVSKLSPNEGHDSSLKDSIAFAKSVFGDLSVNWRMDVKQCGDCSACAGKDCSRPSPAIAGCSQSDCTPVSCDHR